MLCSLISRGLSLEDLLLAGTVENPVISHNAHAGFLGGVITRDGVAFRSALPLTHCKRLSCVPLCVTHYQSSIIVAELIAQGVG